MCDVQALPLKSKAVTEADRYHLATPSFSKLYPAIPSTHAAPLTVTHPLNPLSGTGKHPRHKPLITKKNAASKISPSQRGVGGVSRPSTVTYTKSIHPKPPSPKGKQENHCGNFRGNLTSCPPYSRNATSRMRSGRSPSVANRSAARTDCGVTPKRAAILPVSPRLITILFIF